MHEDLGFDSVSFEVINNHDDTVVVNISSVTDGVVDSHRLLLPLAALRAILPPGVMAEVSLQLEQMGKLTEGAFIDLPNDASELA